mmetsp:Transcript_2345/g.3071  ORF Transcript_2345/g.3071 Transcript_2345/m.3071 type:complete len:169 (-) Transcript_2345:422-928(-)
MLAESNSHHHDHQRGSNTPRRLRVKKLKKRKTKSPEPRTDGDSSGGSIEDDPRETAGNKISQFAKDRNKEEIDDYSSSDSEKEIGSRKFNYGSFSTNCIQYEPQSHENLCAKSKLLGKRNSSPFEKNFGNELNKHFYAEENRRISVSTRLDSDVGTNHEGSSNTNTTG